MIRTIIGWVPVSYFLREANPAILQRGTGEELAGFIHLQQRDGIRRPSCVASLSNSIQKCLPIHVLPKLEQHEPETGLLHELLLLIDNVDLVFLQDLDSALARADPIRLT